MPQTNPYGNFMNIRANELDLDMNRDHVKLEAEGVRAIHRVFRAWMPEVTIDVHEKGDDYYRVSIGCVSNVNIGPDLQDFSRRTILAEVEKSLKKKNFTFHEYLVTEDLGVDTSSGAAYGRGPAGPREEMKRFSTTDLNDGRNSLGIFETLSFIQEGASRHDLETLRERTTLAVQRPAGLPGVGGRARRRSPENGPRRPGPPARKGRGPGRERRRPHADEVRPRPGPAAAASEEIRESRLAHSGRPQGGQEGGRDPLGGRHRALSRAAHRQGRRRGGQALVPQRRIDAVRARPRGYIVRGDRLDIVETLLALGVEVGTFDKDGLVDAEVYEVTGHRPGQARLPGAGEDRRRHEGRAGRRPEGRFLRDLRPAGGEPRAVPPRAPVGVRPHPLLEVQARARGRRRLPGLPRRREPGARRHALQALAPLTSGLTKPRPRPILCVRGGRHESLEGSLSVSAGGFNPPRCLRAEECHRQGRPALLYR